jgi:Domain of unknown function (DUF4189)
MNMVRAAPVIAVIGGLLLAIPASAEVGALAYSPSTDEVSSVSLNMFSLREVQIKALEQCSADDCRILMTFQPGQCAAVASSDKHYGWGGGASEAEADANAIADCARGEDPNCKVVGQHCAAE